MHRERVYEILLFDGPQPLKNEAMALHEVIVLSRKNLFFFVKPYFNVLNVPRNNHEKIQPLRQFFGLRVYYKVKNNKNIKL